MKNYVARAGATLTLGNEGEQSTVDLYSDDGFDMLSNLWIKVAAERRLMYEAEWLGRPIIQFSTDVLVIQELLWELQPDVVIETGVAHGGSLVLSASILELIGKGKVIGVDIEIRPHNRAALDAHRLRHRIELIEGSSVAAETLEHARASVGEAQTVVVFLDSNHSREHVLKEMELYAPLVTPGSYLVAHDGAQAWVWDIPRGNPQWNDDHPLAAIHEFLKKNADFTIDHRRTRFGVTSSPDGFLKKAGAKLP